MARELVVVDFETEAIEPRPDYPPKPVGVAIKYGQRRPEYLAFGHPIENNTTKEEARKILQVFWKGNYDLLFHNAKFDLDVAETHLGLPLPPWERVHDTLFELFLDDPHATSLSLKPAAERLLKMKPEEQERVRDWLVEHGVVRKGVKGWGAHIAKAPGLLVGDYAAGDVERTYKLHKFLHPRILEKGMGKAYDRERRLLPVLLRNEREGIRVDVKNLRRDAEIYTTAQEKADAWLRRRLKVKELNIDSDRELADALDGAGVVTEWVVTETGQKSVSKDNLTPARFKDAEVARVLGYRQRLQTCLSVFVRPWLEVAERTGGLIHTNWNQVRQGHGNDAFVGARTGRLSCSPNFQNIPKIWTDKNDGYEHPTRLQVPALPLLRKYVLPDKGGVFGHRDYNQQELRILAHFEDDKLCRAYRSDPRLDVHSYVQHQIEILTQRKFERRAVKILNFGMVYGMGLGRLAEAIGADVDTARSLRSAQRAAIPGLGALERSTKFRGQSGEPVRTWGGRLYLCEEPKTVNGELRTFEYKMLNMLVQGSAADCTKEALIRYNEAKKDGRFLVTVHDEINISVPRGALRDELQRLREVMESVEFDIPMLSDAKAGPNWGSLKPVNESTTRSAA